MIKDKIKALAAEQVKYKPQRKTKNFKGIRLIDANEATARVANTKYDLMHYYIAYDLLRNKTPQWPKRKVWSKFRVEYLVEKYKAQE